MNEVTRILSAIEQGDPQAAEQLLPLVYDELRKLAAQRLAREKPGQTLQATALIHEAYLRLVEVEKVRHWNSRGHFFAAAAEAMRHILVDRARCKRSRKRGGDQARVAFDEANLAAAEDPEEVLAVDEALAGLVAADAQAAELVKLRYYAGRRALTTPSRSGTEGPAKNSSLSGNTRDTSYCRLQSRQQAPRDRRRLPRPMGNQDLGPDPLG
jgi:RNA polymerase sigma factor (TIGR02999 family)